MDTDNDKTQVEQRDAPGGEVSQRSWVTALATDANQVAVGATITAALYGAKKAVDKFRKPPPPSAGSDGG